MYMRAGVCCHKLGQYDEALSSYDLAIKLKKDTQIADIYYNRGQTYVAL